MAADFPKVGKTFNPNVRLRDLTNATSDNMDFPVFEVRGYGFYIISNLEQDKLFEVRKISDIENFWGRVNMLAKVGLNASENLIELTENVGNSEARDVLMQIGYKTRQDIAKTYPQFDKFILDEICARYNIK